MVKKINTTAIAIKELLDKGFSQKKIAKTLKISKQRVHYWTKTPITPVKKRRKKLDDIYIRKIIELAKDKTTSEMSSSAIRDLINNQLKKDKKDITITKMTVCRILKEKYGTPRKVKKVFYLSKKQKEKRVQFCEEMLKRNISGGQIFFTDETKVSMGSFTKDLIRLSDDTKKKLKNGEEEGFDLINRPEKKYELSIMIAGGVSSQGLSDLILLDGTENEFTYGQILFFFKDYFEDKKRPLFFEQDGATPHTTKSSINLIKKLFGENALIQNPPNSPDLAYPIETLWGRIKPRIKRRAPKTLKELKKYTLEEWRAIPKKLIKETGKNYIKRLKKVIEIGGGRLEDFHLRKIRKELNNEKEEEKDENGKDEMDQSLSMKIAYSDIKLNILKKRHIAKLKKKIEEIKKDTRKKIRALNDIPRIPGVVAYRKKKRKSMKEKKENNIETITKKIEEISKMNIIEYLKYTKKSKKNEKKNDEESTMDESIENIIKLKNLIEEENNGIDYEVDFD